MFVSIFFSTLKRKGAGAVPVSTFPPIINYHLWLSASGSPISKQHCWSSADVGILSSDKITGVVWCQWQNFSLS